MKHLLTRPSPSRVLAIRHWFQVDWLDAMRDEAEVIDGQPLGDWSNEFRESPAMGPNGFPAAPEHAVTPAQTTRPQPAVTTLVDLRPEALGFGRDAGYSNTVTFPVRVMARAKALVVRGFWTTLNTTTSSFASLWAARRGTSERVAMALPSLVVSGAPATGMNRFGAAFNGTHSPRGVFANSSFSHRTCNFTPVKEY